MVNWVRKKDQYLVKSRKLTDGQILHLLLWEDSNSSEFDERIYESLQSIRSACGKSILWVVGSAAFAILYHFKVLKGVSNSGIDVSPVIFGHAALVAMSASLTIFCFSYCKLTYIQSWFSARLKDSTVNKKALYLLKYPDAYWYFTYLPSFIGYPKYIIPKRGSWVQVIYAILVIIVLLIFALGSIGLWLSVAFDVWNSAGISSTLSVCTIILSTAIVILGWLSPFYYDFPRKYDHYGLVDMLGKLTEENLTAAHVRIFRAATNMNLTDRQE